MSGNQAWRYISSELMVNLSAGWIGIILVESWPIATINLSTLSLRLFCVTISLVTAQQLRAT